MTVLATDFILGMGEVGEGLLEILSEGGWNVYGYDASPLNPYSKTPDEVSHADVLHVCIPFGLGFALTVGAWREKLSPDLTIVHSTVPVGTCWLMGAVSSPVVGMHPDMGNSMRAFTKFFGGERASEAAERFRRCGLRVYVTDRSETTEALKLYCTLFYGICIEFTKNIKQEFDRLGLPFEAWSLWVNNYNEGYQAQGHPEYVRPNLVPIMGRLGGHCVAPNAELLPDDVFAQLLLSLNNES